MSLDETKPGAHAQHEDAPQPSFWKSRAGFVTCGFLLIAGFFLLTEHWAHALGVLPYLLILACPLMHLFMHHGHHGGHDHAPRPNRGKEGRNGDDA